MDGGRIYHVCRRADWRAAAAAGVYRGAAQDRADGFIHLSPAGALADTLALHLPAATDLVLLAVDAAALGDALRWEPARDGARFPHLYGPLPVEAVRAVYDLPLGADGRHVLPPLE